MTKAELRHNRKKMRSDLSQVELDKISDLVAERLLGTFQLEGKTISIFLPIERFKEIDTWKIIDQSNAQFVVPVVKGDELVHIQLEGREQLEISEWGIPEPVSGREVDPIEFDMVLVPLLACDEEGNRVGYGKGFYDDFLSVCRPDCQFVGLSHFEVSGKIEDTRNEDIRLNYCITPDKVIEFK